MTIEILRRKAPRNETFVIVRQGGNSWEIDPQNKLFWATGIDLSRSSCILGFADGLTDVFDTVLITKGQGWGWQAGTERHRRSSHISLVYYLLGRAWATNQWDSLVNSLLTYVQKKHRLRVLEETASYYLNHTYESKISLRLPTACSA